MENCYGTSDQLVSMLRHVSESHQTGLPFWKKQHYLLQSWSNTSKKTKHCQIKYTEADEIKSIHHSLALRHIGMQIKSINISVNVGCKHMTIYYLGKNILRIYPWLLFAIF